MYHLINSEDTELHRSAMHRTDVYAEIVQLTTTLAPSNSEQAAVSVWGCLSIGTLPGESVEHSEELKSASCQLVRRGETHCNGTQCQDIEQVRGRYARQASLQELFHEEATSSLSCLG